MAIQGQTLSVEFHRHEKLAVKLHELFLAGLGESPDAEEIRDKMDVTWRKLSAKEVEWDNEIAEDLNALEDETIDDLPELKQLDEFYRRLNANEWLPDLSDADNRFFILSYLRKELKAHPDLVQIIRSIQVENYLALKLFEVSLVISQVSEKKWPEFRIFSVKALQGLGRTQEMMEKAKHLLQGMLDESPGFVNEACEILLGLGVQDSLMPMQNVLRKAIENIGLLRKSESRVSETDRKELSELEASLVAKLGALIGPNEIVKEFPASHSARSLFRRSAKLEPAA
jgi:hypothetical protein